MSSFEVSQMIGQLIVQLIIGSLIGALIIQYVVNKIAKFKPSYGMAFKAEILASAMAIAAVLIFGALSGGFLLPDFLWAFILFIILLVFFIKVWIYSLLIKERNMGPLGFGKACILSLVMLAFVVILKVVGSFGHIQN